MMDKELKWTEERKRLEDNNSHAANADNTTGSRCTTCSSSSSSNIDVSRIQLEAALNDAEDMRKFNATIRSEHDETLAQLESELTGERTEKTKCMSEIVTLRYRNASLEQEIEDFKDAASNALLQMPVSSSSLSHGSSGSFVDTAKERQIQDLRKKIQQLKERDDEHAQELWETKRLHKRELQDKDDMNADMIRNLKTKHEKILIEKDSACLQEVRTIKQKTEQSYQAREEVHLEQLRDAKKKELEWNEREDELLKQMNAEKLTCSFSELEIDNIIRQKEEDFEKRIETIREEKTVECKEKVSKLRDEIKCLKEEQSESIHDKHIVNKLEAQLKECKKECDKQRRRHKSELAKIQNSMDMQKSKEGRLQSHIQSLEKQITDMVNDYESRLQDAFYDQM